jgi:hypothetical protein
MTARKDGAGIITIVAILKRHSCDGEAAAFTDSKYTVLAVRIDDCMSLAVDADVLWTLATVIISLIEFSLVTFTNVDMLEAVRWC